MPRVANHEPTMSSHEHLTADKHRCAVKCLQHFHSVVAATIAFDGTLVSCNTGFSRLLEDKPDARTPTDVRGHFLTPCFSDLLAGKGAAGQPTFVGILNLADKHGIGHSLIGRVYRNHRHLTIVAEYDVADLARLNAGVVALNLELAEVQRDLARANRALQDYSDQLKVLAGGMLDMQESERRALAHQLHEELGQALAAVMIQLSSQKRSANEQNMALDAQIIEIVKGALQQVRRLAHTLRPSVLDDFGLVPALRGLAQQTQARSNVTVQVIATAALVRMESRLETVCFRVVEEALSNVVRHAQATSVLLVLDQVVDDMVLSVHDNGVGFDPVLVCDRMAALAGIGLLGMRERVSGVGGQLEILSKPGAGTTVRLRCPLGQAG